jgi:hypothetical protein
VIRIDVNPARETWYTWHVCFLRQSTYVFVCGNFSRSHQQSLADPLLPRKRAPDNIPSMLADRSTGPHPISLPSQPLKPWGKSQASVDDKLHQFTRPILQHVISTFNTCSRIPTSWSLTDTDGGYNLGGASFQHHSPCPFQPTVLRFPLRVPPGLRLTILNMKPPKSK